MRNLFKNTLSAQKSAEIDVTPMLDVIFILLIFFIVTASFVREKGLDLVQNETAQRQESQPVTPILITIRADNSLWIGTQAVDKRLISARIQRYRSEHPGASVLVAPHNEALNEHLVWVMDAARQAGVQRPQLVAFQ